MKNKAWERWCAIAKDAEIEMFDFYKRHPEYKPEGSFSQNLAIRAYEAGRRAGKKEAINDR